MLDSLQELLSPAQQSVLQTRVVLDRKKLRVLLALNHGSRREFGKFSRRVSFVVASTLLEIVGRFRSLLQSARGFYLVGVPVGFFRVLDGLSEQLAKLQVVKAQLAGGLLGQFEPFGELRWEFVEQAQNLAEVVVEREFDEFLLRGPAGAASLCVTG